MQCCFLQVCIISYPARISCAKILIELENYDVRTVVIVDLFLLALTLKTFQHVFWLVVSPYRSLSFMRVLCYSRDRSNSKQMPMVQKQCSCQHYVVKKLMVKRDWKNDQNNKCCLRCLYDVIDIMIKIDSIYGNELTLMYCCRLHLKYWNICLMKQMKLLKWVALCRNSSFQRYALKKEPVVYGVGHKKTF